MGISILRAISFDVMDIKPEKIFVGVDSTLNKSKKCKKAMTRDEVHLFLNLMSTPNYAVLFNKETNAATNKLKEDAWATLAAAFNTKCNPRNKRNKEQLKLKWDNLKKAARKRTQLIRMNNQNGDDDPDEILDLVASLMEGTCLGTPVPFAGDEIAVSVNPLEIIGEDSTASDQLDDVETTPSVKRAKRSIDYDSSEASSPEYVVSTISEPLQSKVPGKKRKSEDGQLERNLAIANYYNKKAEKIDIEIQLLKLQFNKHKNQ